MRPVFAVLMLCLAALAAPALGGDAREQPIRDVITQQLEAFRRDDADSAFAIASPKIQEMFGNPSRFMAMVTGAYAAVHRPRTVRFKELIDLGNGRLVQTVLVQGPDGAFMMALYEMVEIDGRWRINGCVLEAAPGKET